MVGTVRPKCLHCRERSATESRGLCSRCYRTPAVRPNYLAKATNKAGYGPVCRHCNLRRRNRPRGLCFRCYYTLGVKGQYQSDHPCACRGVGNLTGNRPLPAEACPHPPGTPEKMAVLAGRAERGEQLFHPADHTGGA